MGEEEVVKKVNGGDYVLEILKNKNDFYSYRLNNINELLLWGDEYDSIDSIIIELSEMSNALRSIFG